MYILNSHLMFEMMALSYLTGGTSPEDMSSNSPQFVLENGPNFVLYNASQISLHTELRHMRVRLSWYLMDPWRSVDL